MWYLLALTILFSVPCWLVNVSSVNECDSAVVSCLCICFRFINLRFIMEVFSGERYLF
jgi:hypothetical protein